MVEMCEAIVIARPAQSRSRPHMLWRAHDAGIPRGPPKEAERGHDICRQQLLRTTSRDSREGRQSRWVGEECLHITPEVVKLRGHMRPGAAPRVNGIKTLR